MEEKNQISDAKKIYQKYKEDILTEIANKTKIRWKNKEIHLKKWNDLYWSYKGDTILVGNYAKSKNKILASIIHELIHMNTISKKNVNEFSGSKKKAFAREITTCILTNQIIKIINNKYKVNFAFNNFDEAYSRYNKSYKKFEKLGKDKNYYGFFKIVKKKIK